MKKNYIYTIIIIMLILLLIMVYYYNNNNIPNQTELQEMEAINKEILDFVYNNYKVDDIPKWTKK
jgi:hypothetical protein